MRHTPRDQAWMPTDLGPKRHGRASFWLAIGRPPGGPPRWKAPCAAVILVHNASPGWLGSVARRSRVETPIGIDHDAQRVRARDEPGREQRIVDRNRAGADHDGVAERAEAMHVSH